MQRPLSEEMRPLYVQEVSGQEHLLASGGLLSSLLQENRPLSLLFFGPPGCGKTTLAKIYMRSFSAEVFSFHPASHGMQDLKQWVQKIKNHPLIYPKSILFIDEIHRLTKVTQDALLPHVEEGVFTLVGATTENPSFALTHALLSRLRVLSFHPLEEKALETILEKALHKIQLLHLPLEAKELLIQDAKGDARHLLNNVETLTSLKLCPSISLDQVLLLLSRKRSLYDPSGDLHYQWISAFHKAIRGSDPDAAIYWLHRMLEGGEDPNYLARRMLRIAAEDIGLADPQAEQVVLTSWQTYERLGSPEGDLSLAKAAIFLALCPKSNAIYTAFTESKKLAQNTSHLPPPPSMIQAATTWMKEEGYGKEYLYDHDSPYGCSGQNHFPPHMERPSFYHPKEVGFEREMKKRKDFFDKIRKL